MRSQLGVLLETLRALKKEGTTDVFVEEETLCVLRECVAALAESGISDSDSRPSHAEENVLKKVNDPCALSSVSLPAEVRLSEPEKELTPVFDFSISKSRASSVSAIGTKTERLAALCDLMQRDPVCLEHLHPGKKLVFGEGCFDSSIFFCGEAPGAEEETQGLPFVGPAGQLLTKMIAAMGLSRDRVYIGNIMKWRPELPTSYGNRPPTIDEMAYCLPYLTAQIDIVRPRVIVALGLTAVNGLLGYDPERRIGTMRGKKLSFCEIPVVATYHPSYLLRNDSMKSKRAAWEDFLVVMEIAGVEITERQRNFFL